MFPPPGLTAQYFRNCHPTLPRQGCQETCQAAQNVRCQGCRAEGSTLIASISVSSKTRQGKPAVCQGVKAQSPDILLPRPNPTSRLQTHPHSRGSNRTTINNSRISGFQATQGRFAEGARLELGYQLPDTRY